MCLAGKPQIPRKGRPWPKLQSNDVLGGNRVGPGSLFGPAYPRGLKILLSEEDKGKADTVSATAMRFSKVLTDSYLYCSAPSAASSLTLAG